MIYQSHGYFDLQDYLDALAYEFYIPLDILVEMAGQLPVDEHFNGLVDLLGDYNISRWENLE